MEIDESEIYTPEKGNPWCNPNFHEKIWKNPKWILWPSELLPGMHIRLEADALHLFSFTVIETYHNFFLLKGQSLLQRDYMCILYWPIFLEVSIYSESSTSQDDIKSEEQKEDELNPAVEGAPDFVSDSMDEDQPGSVCRKSQKFQPTLTVIDEHLHPMALSITRMYLLQNIDDDVWNHIKLNYPDYSNSLPIGHFPIRTDGVLNYGFTPKHSSNSMNNRPLNFRLPHRTTNITNTDSTTPIVSYRSEKKKACVIL
jgi:hypothetical protein